jgi:hypothetical protein
LNKKLLNSKKQFPSSPVLLMERQRISSISPKIRDLSGRFFQEPRVADTVTRAGYFTDTAQDLLNHTQLFFGKQL